MEVHVVILPEVEQKLLRYLMACRCLLSVDVDVSVVSDV